MKKRKMSLNRYCVVKKLVQTLEIEVEAVSASAAEDVANSDESTELWADADPTNDWEEIICVQKVE